MSCSAALTFYVICVDTDGRVGPNIRLTRSTDAIAGASITRNVTKLITTTAAPHAYTTAQYAIMLKAAVPSAPKINPNVM